MTEKDFIIAGMFILLIVGLVFFPPESCAYPS